MRKVSEHRSRIWYARARARRRDILVPPPQRHPVIENNS
jgi:hypothetical protein